MCRKRTLTIYFLHVFGDSYVRSKPQISFERKCNLSADCTISKSERWQERQKTFYSHLFTKTGIFTPLTDIYAKNEHQKQVVWKLCLLFTDSVSTNQ